MNALRLPDGRVLVPRRAEAKGVIGDGLVAVAADSAEAKEWHAWTEPASAATIQWWAKFETEQDNG